jgi:hypothetical protein
MPTATTGRTQATSIARRKREVLDPEQEDVQPHLPRPPEEDLETVPPREPEEGLHGDEAAEERPDHACGKCRMPGLSGNPA